MPADVGELIAEFERGGEKLRAAVAGLSPEQLKAYPVPGTWSIHEIAVHMMDSDGIGIDRMKRVIAEELPLLLGYNETRFIQRLHPHALPPDVAMDVFEKARKLFAITLRKLNADDFERAGIHNEIGKKTLGEFLKTYVGHLDHHLTFIDKKRAMLLSGSAGVGVSPATADADRALVALYERQPAEIRAMIAGMSRDQLLARPIEGKWSMQELVIHLADADTVFAHRLQRILSEDEPRYEAWSEHRFIERLDYNSQSAEDAVAIVELTHRQISRILRAQPAGALGRTGTHSQRGVQSGRQVLEYATWHIMHHLKFAAEKRAKLDL